MPTLPARPSFENLKKQAKTLLKAAQSGDTRSHDRIGPYFGDPAKITLQQAHLVIAREYGFSSWTRLKRHIESGAGAEETTEERANRFLDLVCIHYGPDTVNRSAAQFEQAAELLKAHPEIAQHSLHTAAAAGAADAVEAMLAAAPETVDTKGGPFQWTPLMYAAYARPGVSTYPAGKLLIAAGADPNAHYMSYGTYRFAVLTGVFGDGEGGLVRQPPHPEMELFARALLDAGANPNDSQGAYNRSFSPDDTHLKLMLEYGLKDSDPSDWWLTEPDRDPKDHRTMHFQLIIAMRFGFPDRARLLIENGVDINTPDNNYYPTYTVGYTPYQVALMRGMPEIAELIRAKGGRVDPLEPYAAFQAACMAGDTETATALTAVNFRRDTDKDHELLLDAANTGNLPAIQTMITIGFALNKRGTRTALHAAAYQGHLDVVKALVAAGADTTLRDPDYHTPPVVHAMHGFEDETVAYLMTQPLDIFAATALYPPNRVAAMLDEDSNLVQTRFKSVRTSTDATHDRDWATPLWFAVVNGRADMVTLLLDRGADPHVADGSGQTIIDYAENVEQQEIAAILRQHPSP